jgi:hypothetical protein
MQRRAIRLSSEKVRDASEATIPGHMTKSRGRTWDKEKLPKRNAKRNLFGTHELLGLEHRHFAGRAQSCSHLHLPAVRSLSVGLGWIIKTDASTSPTPAVSKVYRHECAPGEHFHCSQGQREGRSATGALFGCPVPEAAPVEAGPSNRRAAALPAS